MTDDTRAPADRIVGSWAGLASHFIGECFDMAKLFIDQSHEGLDPLVRFVSAQLYIECHLSSESALLLVRAQKEWDAEVIARSVMEGSLKLMYMFEGTPEEIRTKVHEYWNVLPLFYAIRHSERAKQILDALPESDRGKWEQSFRDLLVPDSEINETRARFSRQARQTLEEKWSFSGLCKEFAQSEKSERRKLVHLAHNYGMSSHLLHKDGDGIGMAWDRRGREPQRQDAAKLGHNARLVSDICVFSQLRLFSLLRACGQPTEGVHSVRERYSDQLFSELEKAGSKFVSVEYQTGRGGG
jgi:hypothetical protein